MRTIIEQAVQLVVARCPELEFTHMHYYPQAGFEVWFMTEDQERVAAYYETVPTNSNDLAAVIAAQVCVHDFS